MPADATPVTRLAPTPSGALHLGNARTFLANWLLARQAGWRVVLRIDDAESPRNRPGADRQAVDDLRWLGLDWDVGPVYQSARRDAHEALLTRLTASGGTYWDTRTRDEVAADAAGRRAEDGAPVDPGTARDRHPDHAHATATGRPVTLRLAVPDGRSCFNDAFRGETCAHWSDIGDFPLKTPAGHVSYHVATVADDLADRVTHIVRGDDLITSTHRQLLLLDRLDLPEHQTNYTHLPLVVGRDGRKLSKRHGDTRLASYRESGRPARDVLTLLAGWLGIEGGDAGTAGELIGRFDLTRVPRSPIVYEADDGFA